LAAGHDIIKVEGFGALWAGLGPTYWGYLLEGAVKFGETVYDSMAFEDGNCHFDDNLSFAIIGVCPQWDGLRLCSFLGVMSHGGSTN
jgi:hypothetical protein